MSKLTVQLWNEKQFSSAQQEWNDLLSQSNADQFFLSWEWMHTWWTSFADSASQLLIYSVYNEQKELVGLAPLFVKQVISKRIIKTNRLQFIGSDWYNPKIMRTELLEFISVKSMEKAVISALLDEISHQNQWNELIFSDLRKDSETYQQLSNHTTLKKYYSRKYDSYKSYYLDTQQSFENYLKNLGKNTRLKLFNRRKILQEVGEVNYESFSQLPIEESFKQLNDLHKLRWDKDVFTKQKKLFNLKLAQLFNDKKSLKFSTLSVNGELCSIQYNFLINDHEYNIQAGFKTNLHKKLALGYLHFGFAIESACNDPNINTYDFLVGEGKNTDYKSHLTTTSLELTHVQIIRGGFAQIFYRLYDSLKSRK